MVALYIFLGLLGLLTLALVLPVRLCLYYDDAALRFRVKYLWFCLYDSEAEEVSDPSSALKTIPKTGQGKRSNSAVHTLLFFLGLEPLQNKSAFRATVEKRGLSATIGDICSALGGLFSQLGRLVKKGRFHRFRLQITVGGADPGEAAGNYGCLCALVYPAAAALVPPKRQNISLTCDFDAAETQVCFDGTLHYRPWYFVCFLCGIAGQYLKRKAIASASDTPNVKKEEISHE